MILAACGIGGPESTDSTIVLGRSELDVREEESVEFIERFHGLWPDVEAAFSVYAEDGLFSDISFGDYWIGPSQIVAGHQVMAAFAPAMEADLESVFLTTERAAFGSVFVNLWLGEKPAEADWPAALEVFGFDGGQVSESEIWYTTDTLEGPMHSCGGCAVDLETLADAYITRWSSRNTDEIAALYSEDALILDSMFGIKANGIDEIERLIPMRFGSGEPVREADKLYGTLLANSLIRPGSGAESGDITGVGVQFSWSAGDEAGEVETLVLLYFGEIEDGSYEAHSGNLIVREEVFHNPKTLTGLAP
jgi:hypothetical protein